MTIVYSQNADIQYIKNKIRQVIP